MVLESITNPFRAEKKPWTMFLIGALYASIALFLGNWIFKEYASLMMVFLTTMACIPLLYHTMKAEERKDTAIEGLVEFCMEKLGVDTIFMVAANSKAIDMDTMQGQTAAVIIGNRFLLAEMIADSITLNSPLDLLVAKNIGKNISEKFFGKKPEELQKEFMDLLKPRGD